MFVLNEHHLWELCEKNEVPVSKTGMVFFGFRGCLPVNPNDCSFAKEHALIYINVDYIHPRCTLGQWLPAEGVFAVFPGSTVPQRGVFDSPTHGWASNSESVTLISGFYQDFKKGMEMMGSNMAHEAFLQSLLMPVRYMVHTKSGEFVQSVITDEAGDAITSAWCLSVDKRFRSNGDQVIVGFPQCTAREGLPASGPWKEFHDNAYQLDQNSFDYLLLSGLDAQRVAYDGGKSMERVRFGSRGERSRRVQEALKSRGYYEGELDGWFGPRSVRALRAFQRRVFGEQGEEGLCGYQTAQLLDIPWP